MTKLQAAHPAQRHKTTHCKPLKSLTANCIPTLCLAILIAFTARPVQASTAINPRLDGPDRYQTSATIAKKFSD
ncbi:MAG: cell wall-binding repeat-containing protein [Desulfitobacterium sp.]